MLRRLTPILATILAMLLDTAVIPVLYHGVYTVPLTLIVAMCIGLSHGRLRGLLFGMIGGLLIDITAGTLGFMTFYFMLAGFLIDLIVDERSEQNTRAMPALLFHLRRLAVAFCLSLLGEVVFELYHYFITASFDWATTPKMLTRSLIVAAGTVILCPILDRIEGKNARNDRSGHAGRQREVKYY